MEDFETGRRNSPAKNLAVAALITGIIGLFSFLMPPLQFGLGVAAIVLAILSARRQKPMSAFAGAGLVMGVQCVVISVLLFLYVVFILNMLKDNPNLLQDMTNMMR